MIRYNCICIVGLLCWFAICYVGGAAVADKVILSPVANGQVHGTPTIYDHLFGLFIFSVLMCGVFCCYVPRPRATPTVAVQRNQYSDNTPSSINILTRTIEHHFQYYLDKLTPFILYRWITFLCIALIYILRIYFVQGFYLVSYTLAFFSLILVGGFLSPQVDPQLQALDDGPTPPVRASDEFRPFVRRLPEFEFWYSITTAFCVAFLLTFFSIFDVGVIWQLLLFHWIVVFAFIMRGMIMHMMKYEYVPFNFGKQRYGTKKESSTDIASLLPAV